MISITIERTPERAESLVWSWKMEVRIWRMVSLMLPMTLSLAAAAGVSPIPPALGATIGASWGFMLPISTAPNAMAYGTGQVTVRQVVSAGVAFDVLGFGIIDDIIREPIGGAHTDHDAAAAFVDEVLSRELAEVKALDVRARLDRRYEKFRSMGRLGIEFMDGEA